MPRKPLILTDEYPYHILNRSNNKDFFYIPLDHLWDIFIESFSYLERELKVVFHSFVLMSNHYHLIISTPQKNMSEAMTYLHREVARKSNRHSGRVNHFFGSRYKWSLIGSEQYYWHALKYVFRNPVKAGLCQNVEEYKYSSLNQRSFNWKLIDFFCESHELVGMDLDWLNEGYLAEEDEALQKAFKRKEFKPCKNRNGYLLELSSGESLRNYALLRQKGLGT